RRLSEALERSAVVAPLQGEVALSRPCGGAVTRRGQSCKARLRLRKAFLGLLEPAGAEQGAAEHDLRVAELVEVVDPAPQELDRVPRVLLRLRVSSEVELDARERGDRLRGVGVVAGVEGDRERLLEELGRALG